MKLTKDLMAASAAPLVLAILSEGESYGYAIIQRVRELSGGKIEWTDGMLYPVLHRLEAQGVIAAKWRQSETGRKRRYYTLQRQGKSADPAANDDYSHGPASSATGANRESRSPKP